MTSDAAARTSRRGARAGLASYQPGFAPAENRSDRLTEMS